MLDSFGSVAEAVAALEAEPLFVRTVSTPDGHAGTMHVAISDPAGDSAIFEYIDGALQIHHGREYQVMTNSPEFSQQLALNTYWEKIGGAAMLPGTSRAADRFVRASYYLSTVKPTADPAAALASVFGIVRNASVPLGIASAPGEPNIASTLWRTVTDHTNRVYYFESTESPFLVWLRLDDLDFSVGAPVMKLTLSASSAAMENGHFSSGNATAQLHPAEPFPFLEATA